MNRLAILLSPEEYWALEALSRKQLRPITEQARYLVVRELRRERLLQPLPPQVPEVTACAK